MNNIEDRMGYEYQDAPTPDRSGWSGDEFWEISILCISVVAFLGCVIFSLFF